MGQRSGSLSECFLYSLHCRLCAVSVLTRDSAVCVCARPQISYTAQWQTESARVAVELEGARGSTGRSHGAELAAAAQTRSRAARSAQRAARCTMEPWKWNTRRQVALSPSPSRHEWHSDETWHSDDHARVSLSVTKMLLARVTPAVMGQRKGRRWEDAVWSVWHPRLGTPAGMPHGCGMGSSWVALGRHRHSTSASVQL